MGADSFVDAIASRSAEVMNTAIAVDKFRCTALGLRYKKKKKKETENSKKTAQQTKSLHYSAEVMNAVIAVDKFRCIALA